MYSLRQEELDAVNLMSDHNAQVDLEIGLVSQNLQGPYAIKHSGDEQNFFYTLDMPFTLSSLNPDYDLLAKLTGMDKSDCGSFIKYNDKRNQTDGKGKDRVDAILKNYKDFSRPLGYGGIRLPFETNTAYENRMRRQITHLINIIQGGANILSLQEQPYLHMDKSRYQIFKKIMNDLGYESAADLNFRDVGIWAKKGLTKKKVTLPGLSDGILLGCAAEINGVLCVNVHVVDRVKADDIVTALIKAKEQALQYANQKTPPLKISITGDMNLYELPPVQKSRLADAGFNTELVKGQEIYTKPTYEAFLLADNTSCRLAHETTKNFDNGAGNGNALQLYYKTRDSDKREYFGILDRFFGGYDRDTKLNAALKLMNYDPENGQLKLTQREYNALKQGRLKNIASDMLSDMEKNEIIRIIEDGSDSDESSTLNKS